MWLVVKAGRPPPSLAVSIKVRVRSTHLVIRLSPASVWHLRSVGIRSSADSWRCGCRVVSVRQLHPAAGTNRIPRAVPPVDNDVGIGRDRAAGAPPTGRGLWEVAVFLLLLCSTWGVWLTHGETATLWYLQYSEAVRYTVIFMYGYHYGLGSWWTLNIGEAMACTCTLLKSCTCT